jgi:hypothetical protein
MTQWQAVTPAKAEQNPFYGFRGWLYVFYAYAIIEVLMPMGGLFGDGRGLALMYGPENVSMMRIVCVVNLLLPLPFLILTPMKHRLMPVLTIIPFWISPFVFLSAMIIGSVEPQKILGVFFLNAVTAAAYTWYLLQSKRINITYCHRAPV